MKAGQKAPIESLPITISYKLLLGMYLVLPISIAIHLIDLHFYDGHLRDTLKTNPQQYFIFQLFFGTPHIVASNIILLSNKEYFRYYRTKFFVVTLLIIAFFSIGNFVLSYPTLYILVAAFTVIHVIKQQFGLGNSICRLSGWPYFLWSWTGIFLSVILYISIFLGGAMEAETHQQLSLIFKNMSAFFILLGLICHFQIKSNFGKAFFWSNTLIILGIYYLSSQEYYFFAIFVPRIIHDVTAFIFYIAHDYNRHQKSPKNLLYKITGHYKFLFFLVLPFLAIFITYLMRFHGDEYLAMFTNATFNFEIPKAFSLGIIGYLSLMHYYTEAITWKNDSPYRQFIQFKK